MSQNRKRMTCGAAHCLDDPYLGGLCRRHHLEDLKRQERRQSALECLTTQTIDGRISDDLELREELFRLVKWWDRVRFALQTERDCERLPLDEAEYAMEWCIGLAAEIVDAELAVRAGKPVSSSLVSTRHWVWERFRNLEQGLMSNGLPRSPGRTL